MRSKEFAHDYRYFPEPDLLPVRVAHCMARRRSHAQMPELPEARRTRFERDFGLSAYDAGVLTATRALADYFEKTVAAGAPPKSAANWIRVELLRRLKMAERTSTTARSRLARLLRWWHTSRAANHCRQRQESIRDHVRNGTNRAAEIIAAEGFSQSQRYW